MDACVSCKREVTEEEKAMACDLCDKWEHVGCLKRSDKLTDELYDALVGCRSKSVLYVCTPCRAKGTITNRLHMSEFELARTQDARHEERLASAQRVDELNALVMELRDEKKDLITRQTSLEGEIQVLTKQMVSFRGKGKSSAEIAGAELQPVVDKVVRSEKPTEDTSLPVTQTEGSHDSDGSDSSSDASYASGSNQRGHLPNRQSRKCDPHPPGFRSLTSRIDKFSGKRGDDDFEIWLLDFTEATNDCGWSNQQRARWFSWFLTGPAKATWQHTVKERDKASWSKIVEIYRGQYGVHLDPRTAYQRCQDLQYSQFGSAQGLLDAMRDYQRMAPRKLNDETLESILWNKVPLELQKELGEIPAGSVQELLQRLLRAKIVIQERARRGGSGERIPKKERQSETVYNKFGKVSQDKNSSNSTPTKPKNQVEMFMKGVKCFKCQKTGHIARNCTESKTKSSLRVDVDSPETEEESESRVDQDDEMWMRTILSESDTQAVALQVALKGPTYKVDIVVDGIKTRALLDSGAQVSLARQQLLPHIKQKSNWSIEQCRERNFKLDGQPLGAGGESLGAKGIVALQVTIEGTNVSKCVPCYILDSSKPIWRGELQNCCLILGTNAMEDLGYKIIDSVGQPVMSSSHAESAVVRQVVLSQTLRLGPQQTRVARVELSANDDEDVSSQVGVVTPDESVLASDCCDLMEGYWTGESDFNIPVTNWGVEPVVLTKGTVIGVIDTVSVVEMDDNVWKDESFGTVAIVNMGNGDRENLLKTQLTVGRNCTPDQRVAIINLMKKKLDVFALTDKELGETDLVEHSIDMSDTTPVKSPPRRLPYALRNELESELQHLLDTGCIESSGSSFASGLVLVRKKDGSLRVCVDYRGINKKTIPDQYPIPRIDDLIDAVGRCKGKIFTTLDLMKGYHQIKMAPDSRDKTAFTCHLGLFQYRRMPFGLTNAPATFQRLMNKLFSGRDWSFVFVYLDDLLIVSQSFEEHLVHVEKVLHRLQEAGLRLKPQKCAFAQSEIKYLGHTLSPQGVRPNDSKVRAVKEFSTPTCCKEVKSFLGLVNFYRRHLSNLAVVARPLTALTRKDKETGSTVPFVWDSQCESAFQEVKRMLVSAPLLHPPDLDKPFFLWTDACGKGFGALLEQESDDGRRYPIAYASRQTNVAESSYAPTELEVAALVYTVEHFEVYLLGNDFTVYTDHKSLVSAFLAHLKNQSKGLLARWYLRISRFLPKMKIEYKPGSANVVADCLSRAPLPATEVAVLQISESDESLLQLVRQEQRQDQELVQLMNYLEDRSLPDNVQAARHVVGQAKKGFILVDGILYYEGGEFPAKRRLVVPAHLHQKIVDEHHDGSFAGHFSVKRMSKRIGRYFYWRGMNADVLKKCESCVSCASVQGCSFVGKPLLVSVPVGGPFECLGMDFVELDLSESGKRYALVFQDYLTKWPEVYAVSDHKAETVAQCLIDLIWRHGVPNRIIHDRAPEFLSDVLQETAHLMGITQLPTSGGHPQTNGLVERFNRTLKQMLAKVVTRRGRNWDKVLGAVLFAYRSTPHQSTGETPFYLVYGREPNLPTAMNFHVPVTKFPVVETDYGVALEKELKYARSLAKQNLETSQKQQKKYYDKKAKGSDLKVGDLVMLKVQPKFKLDKQFQGPFVIVSLTNTNAVIQVKGDEDGETMIVSRQRLSKCSVQMAKARPWLGQSGKLRKTRTVRKPKPRQSKSAQDAQVDVQDSAIDYRTRSGRTVRRPARLIEDRHDGQSFKGGGSCKRSRDGQSIGSREVFGRVSRAEGQQEL